MIPQENVLRRPRRPNPPTPWFEKLQAKHMFPNKFMQLKRARVRLVWQLFRQRTARVLISVFMWKFVHTSKLRIQEVCKYFQVTALKHSVLIARCLTFQTGKFGQVQKSNLIAPPCTMRWRYQTFGVCCLTSSYRKSAHTFLFCAKSTVTKKIPCLETRLFFSSNSFSIIYGWYMDNLWIIYG